MASSQPSAKEEQPPMDKSQELDEEDDDAFISYYYDRETYYKLLKDFSVLGDEECVHSDGERELTEEEEKAYRDAVESTDGFDVPEFPDAFCYGMITPMSVDDDTLEYLFPFSVAAIKVYNEENGTKYEVVQVEKAMQQTACGLNHYITFQAKIGTAYGCDTTKTFEALVLMGIPKKEGDDATEVIFCREKGAKRAEEKVENEHEEDGSVKEEEEVEDV